ncbi:MIP/aquaporin family protein [Mucilaginibacter arboris]|uniref:Aquaporin n=1 Tax=Mucilaginibacter arboris TaxID=2682090 RepID=A0A7K1STS7_9SPHI|nr:aquaporin [Mucilaginibacter arboris]MVN20694.1 aquaporin [Mucilaginibacter arboris]
MKKYIAEYFATFGLMFFGTGTVVVSQEIPGLIFKGGGALAFGLIVTLMIYAFGKISGANMNPVVSFTFAWLKMHSYREAFFYTIFQAGGAFSASFILHFLFPLNKNLGGTLPSGAVLQSFFLEIFLTFLLILIVLLLSEASPKVKVFAAIIIGLVVGLEAFFAGPISGASMNPIRSLAPAVVSHQLQHWWIYLFAPFIGAFLAAAVWKYVFKSQHSLPLVD